MDSGDRNPVLEAGDVEDERGWQSLDAEGKPGGGVSVWRAVSASCRLPEFY